MACHVVLIGLMGSGKTSIGRIVADRTGRRLLDSDALLQDRTGTTAVEYAERHGVEELHRVERQVLREALGQQRSAVITAAASVADDEDAARLLADHHVVWVTADLKTLVDRVRDPKHRPLVGDAPEAVLQEQATRRIGTYQELADVIVDSGLLSPEQAATTVLRHAPPLAS